MPSDGDRDLSLEIGHVLFIDIVEYSKLLINEQSEVLARLNEMVRGSEQVRAAEADAKLIRLPTGDGMALVFRSAPEAPVRCAVELSRAIKRRPELQVRMGIHSGPINEVTDVNERTNVAGPGINLAQRVMECGDAGHVLLSKRVADDLAHYRHWKPFLHELGECEVKHGMRLAIVNLFSEDIGNPARPEKLKRPDASRSIREQQAVSASPPPETIALAVLPFENVGGEARNEHLSDGVADHLIISLSQVRRHSLIVRPFSSASRYKRHRPDPATIGRELNVRTLVTGTLHKVGRDLHVSVELIDALADRHIWGKRYQASVSAILDLQDQIARDVADSLRLKLSSAEERRLTKRYTQDPDAYLLCREGVHCANKFTEAGLVEGIEHLSRAIQLDANYALAHAELGNCYMILGSLYRGPAHCAPQAKPHFETARRIDDTLAEAQGGIANLSLFYEWDWPAAEREIGRALQMGPDTPLPFLTHAFYLAAVGRPADGLEFIRRALALDPVAAPRRNEMAMCFNWLRQYELAVPEAHKAIKLDPHFPLAYAELATALVHKGSPDEAITILETVIRAGNSHPRLRGMLGYALASAGRSAESRSVLDTIEQLAKGRYGYALSAARIHAALGGLDEGFTWLKRACEERDSHVIWLKVDPTLDPLRADSRFNDALENMKLSGR